MGQLLLTGSSTLLLTAGGCPVYGAPGGPFVHAGGSGGQGGAPPNDASLSGGSTSVGGTCSQDGPPGALPCSSATVPCDDLCVSPNDPAYGCGDLACVPCEPGSTCDAGACVPSKCEPGLADCDGDPSNGCELDTSFDASNCGECNRDCLGEACFYGQCEATTLVDGQGEIGDISIDDDTVYFTTKSSGTVVSVPKAGGSASVLASNLESPGSIAVDDQSLFLTTETAIVTLPKSGGDSKVLASQQDPLWDLAIDSDFVYWVTTRDCGAVKRVPKNSTQRVTLASDQGTPWSIAVDGSFVYWLDSKANTVMKLDKSGAGVPVVLAAGQSWPRNLAIDADGLYFSHAPAEMSAVASVALTGGAALTVASKQLVPAGVATDATHVYWVSSGVYRVPKAGGSVEHRVYSGGFGTGLAVDSTHVYFADTGRILRAAK